MKPIKFIVVGLAVLVLGVSVMAQEPQSFGSIGFFGVRYDDKVLISGGFGAKLAGHIYSFSYADVGRYGALNQEVAYIVGVAPKLSLGAVAGPNVDWITTTGQEPTAYLAATGGFVAGYDLNPKVGLWFYGKYKTSLDDKNLYEDGFIGGVGFYVRL